MCDSLVKAQLSTFASVAEKNKIVSLADNCWFLASFNCWNNHCLGSSDYIFFGFLKESYCLEMIEAFFFRIKLKVRKREREQQWV